MVNSIDVSKCTGCGTCFKTCGLDVSAETAVSMNGKKLWSPCLSVRALYRYVPLVMENGYGIIKKFCEGLGYLDGSRRLWPLLKGVTHFPFPSLSHEF